MQRGAAAAALAPLLEEAKQRIRTLPYLMRDTTKPWQPLLDDAALKDEWEAHFQGVTPIITQQLPTLLDDFLKAKRTFGTKVEQELYANMSPPELCTRLLHKRPLTFWLGEDAWCLRSGENGAGGFDYVGKDVEASRSPSLRLADVMSYDEIALAALVSVSVPTHFVNSGSRFNAGRPGEAGSFERVGVYTGCVGARFERPNVMEWAHLMVTPQQNTPANGYGPAEEAGKAALAAADAAGSGDGDGGNSALLRFQLLQAWARFYDVPHLPTFHEANQENQARPGAFLAIGGDPARLLNVALYRRRMRATIEPFLLDAERRAAAMGTRAYVHVVGLGLGVWMVDLEQARYMLSVYADVLRERRLPHLAALDFSWFPDLTNCGGAASGEALRGGPNGENAPTVLFSRRDPAATLPPSPAGEKPMLLVAMYVGWQLLPGQRVLGERTDGLG